MPFIASSRAAKARVDLGINRGHVDQQLAGLARFRDAVRPEHGALDDRRRVEAQDDEIAERRFARASRGGRALGDERRDLGRIEIEDAHAMTGLDQPGRDGAAHDAGADDADRLSRRIRHRVSSLGARLSSISASLRSASGTASSTLASAASVTTSPSPTGGSNAANWLSTSEAGM